ncbi:uncharacterized protein LOC144712209 [Wolffia australiana]
MDCPLSISIRAPSPPSCMALTQSPATTLKYRLSSSVPSSNFRIQSPGFHQERARICCRSGGSSSSGPDSGENESKAALDAFFLGKALAEAINERIASNVGEFLSIVGQWQAEQQKQVQEFQEEVIQKAKKDKEKAAAEALGSSPAPVIRRPPSKQEDSDPFGEMLNGQ